MPGQSELPPYVSQTITPYVRPVPKRLSIPVSYCEGFFSYRENINEADNPYQFGIEDYWAWRRGWYAAKAEWEIPWYRRGGTLSSVIMVIVGVFTIIMSKSLSPEIYGIGITVIGILVFISNYLSKTGEIRAPTIIIPLFRRAGINNEGKNKNSGD